MGLDVVGEGMQVVGANVSSCLLQELYHAVSVIKREGSLCSRSRQLASQKSLFEAKETVLSNLKNLDQNADCQRAISVIASLKEELPTQGRVAFMAPWIEELGLKVGDVVGFQENRDYRIKIDGKEYYRTRVEDLLGVYIEENV